MKDTLEFRGRCLYKCISQITAHTWDYYFVKGSRTMHTSERAHKMLALLFLQNLEMNLDHISNCQLIGLLINSQ